MLRRLIYPALAMLIVSATAACLYDAELPDGEAASCHHEGECGDNGACRGLVHEFGPCEAGENFMDIKEGTVTYGGGGEGPNLYLWCVDPGLRLFPYCVDKGQTVCDGQLCPNTDSFVCAVRLDQLDGPGSQCISKDAIRGPIENGPSEMVGCHNDDNPCPAAPPNLVCVAGFLFDEGGLRSRETVCVPQQALDEGRM